MATKRRKRRSKNSKDYFTQVHEDAIVAFANTNDHRLRNELYSDIIKPVLEQMIEKIVLTYKFTNLPNIDTLKVDCEVHLVQILSNFDPSRGKKAFSYFSVITKNWFVAKVKKATKQAKRESYYDEIPKNIESEYLSIENPYIEIRQRKEFLEQFWTKIAEWENQELKANERRVLEAIKVLFRDAEDIEIFNKKAVYLYLREITNLNTKQVLGNLKKFRKLYLEFRNQWLNEENK